MIVAGELLYLVKFLQVKPTRGLTFSDYLKEKPEINNASVEDICKIACATAGVKCLFDGFFLNPICHATVGVCTACIIYWIVKLF